MGSSSQWVLIIAQGHNRDIFSVFFKQEGILCVLIKIASSSNEYTHYTIFNIKKKKKLNYPKYSYEIFRRESKTSSKQPW